MGSCRCSKQKYSKKDALTSANKRVKGRQRIRRHRPEYLRAYYCEDCNAWHLTRDTEEEYEGRR